MKGIKTGPEQATTVHGNDYFVFHAYDATDKGHSKLKIAEMEWTEEGWPTIDKNVLATDSK